MLQSLLLQDSLHPPSACCSLVGAASSSDGCRQMAFPQNSKCKYASETITHTDGVLHLRRLRRSDAGSIVIRTCSGRSRLSFIVRTLMLLRSLPFGAISTITVTKFVIEEPNSNPIIDASGARSHCPVW